MVGAGLLEPVRNGHSYGGMLTYLLAELIAPRIAIIDRTQRTRVRLHADRGAHTLESVVVLHMGDADGGR